MDSQYILRVFLVVALYWSVSILLVFVNKFLIDDQHQDTDISMFITWMQCIANVILLLFGRCIKIGFNIITGRHRNHEKKKETWPRRLRTMKKIMIVSVTYIGMLYLNNLCLRSVGVSFYNTARSMTLVFTAVFSNLILAKGVSKGPFLCCIVVCFGFLLGIDQENDAGNLKIEGLCYGVLASVVGSLNVIYIKKTLEVVSSSAARFTLYNNINAAILCLPLIIVTGEVSHLTKSSRLAEAEFWYVLGASGFLSLGIAWASAVQIDLTSPLTHNVSANSKAVLQSLIAVIHFQETKPVLWWLSIALVGVGSTLYALLRIREERLLVIQRRLEKPRGSIHRLRSREESESYYGEQPNGEIAVDLLNDNKTKNT